MSSEESSEDDGGGTTPPPSGEWIACDDADNGDHDDATLYSLSYLGRECRRVLPPQIPTPACDKPNDHPHHLPGVSRKGPPPAPPPEGVSMLEHRLGARMAMGTVRAYLPPVGRRPPLFHVVYPEVTLGGDEDAPTDDVRFSEDLTLDEVEAAIQLAAPPPPPKKSKKKRSNKSSSKPSPEEKLAEMEASKLRLYGETMGRNCREALMGRIRTEILPKLVELAAESLETERELTEKRERYRRRKEEEERREREEAAKATHRRPRIPAFYHTRPPRPDTRSSSRGGGQPPPPPPSGVREERESLAPSQILARVKLGCHAAFHHRTKLAQFIKAKANRERVRGRRAL